MFYVYTYKFENLRIYSRFIVQLLLGCSNARCRLHQVPPVMVDVEASRLPTTDACSIQQNEDDESFELDSNISDDSDEVPLMVVDEAELAVSMREAGVSIKVQREPYSGHRGSSSVARKRSLSHVLSKVFTCL